MSLNIALYNAVSGLQTASRSLDVTAQNVSNVNTEGYSRKTVQLQAQVIAGQGAGVEIASISRKVNDFLIKELRTSVTELGDADVLNEFYSRMQDMFGTLGSDTSPAIGIAELATKFQALSDTPENISLRTDLVERARLLTEQFVDIATEIEALRVEVDRAIADATTSINTQLVLIQDLNIRIAEGLALNQGVAEMQDQRDIALDKVAQEIDIQQFSRANGEVVVLTKLGRTLVDRTALQLSHTSVSAINPLVTHASGAIDGITLSGTDITSEIGSGRIAGLIAMRDTILPNLHSQMQELVNSLHDEINALHNQGTAFPGLTSVTGTRVLAAGDPPPWTGTFRVAVTDTSGVVLEFQDFNLAAMPTVNDLIVAMNGMANLNASLNAQGQVVITPTGANRVAFNEMSSSVTMGNRTMGAADFLGLNDFFTSANNYSEYGSSYQFSRTNPLGVAGTLTFSGAFGTTTVSYAAGDSLDAVTAAVNANPALTAAGVGASVISDGSGFRLRINDPVGDNFFITDSSPTALLNTINLKVRNTQVVSQIAVRSDMISDPSLVVRGTLSADPALAVGDIGLTAGDKTAIQAIANQFNVKLSFDATNLLAASTSTLSQYASEILSLNAGQANAANETLDARQILVDNLKAQTRSISGVNLDEEMSLMIILENAYAASARVITTTQNMFEMLTDMVR